VLTILSKILAQALIVYSFEFNNLPLLRRLGTRLAFSSFDGDMRRIEFAQF
jgi:hypothetical protein